MTRVKIVYRALVAVLAALAFFLLAAGVRVLLGRRRPAEGGAPPSPETDVP